MATLSVRKFYNFDIELLNVSKYQKDELMWFKDILRNPNSDLYTGYDEDTKEVIGIGGFCGEMGIYLFSETFINNFRLYGKQFLKYSRKQINDYNDKRKNDRDQKQDDRDERPLYAQVKVGFLEGQALVRRLGFKKMKGYVRHPWLGSYVQFELGEE